MTKLQDLQKQLQLEQKTRLDLERQLNETQRLLEQSEAVSLSVLKNQKQQSDIQDERFQDIINLSSEAVWELDINGKTVYSNTKLSDLLGFTQEKMKNKVFFDFLDREGRALALKNYMLIKEGIERDLDFKLIDRFGNEVWVLASVKPKWVNDKMISLIALLTDITIRKKAENEVKDLKNFYQGVLNSLPTDLAVLDTNQKYIYVNPSFIKNPETRAWVIGKSDSDLVEHKKMRKRTAFKRAKHFDYVVKNRKNIEWQEFTLIKGIEDSQQRRLSPVFDTEGELKYVISFGVDVNERIAAEKKTNLLKELVNNSTEGLFILNSKAIIKYSNFVAERLLGVTFLENEKGISLFSSDNPLIEQLKWGGLIETLKQQKEVVLELERDIDGENGIYELKLTYVKRKKEVFIVVFSSDVTERKRFEEELVNAKIVAESASSAKAQFLSVMSHEIRTPMNAVIGLTHLLLQNKPRNDQKDNLQTLKFSAENLLALINDILDFSKIDAGKIDFENSEFVLEDIVKGLYHSFHLQAEEKNIELKFEIDKELPKVLVGDSTRLTQILTNLVSNAVKFTDKGSVELKVYGENINGGKMELIGSVTDSGIGIPFEKQQHVFETFTQASSSTTRQFGGTGLGLAITKKLIDLQRGGISVVSEINKGTVFNFYIPYAYNQNKKEIDVERGVVADEELFSSLKGYKVLLVEDNPVNVMVADQFLQQWDLEIDHAENGKQAIQKLSKNDYDVILMDIQMPVMDGFTATTVIRKLAISEKRDIPIVALTASAMIEVQEKVFKVGMNDFVTKPFNPSELYTKLAKQVRK